MEDLVTSLIYVAVLFITMAIHIGWNFGIMLYASNIMVIVTILVMLFDILMIIICIYYYIDIYIDWKKIL